MRLGGCRVGEVGIGVCGVGEEGRGGGLCGLGFAMREMPAQVNGRYGEIRERRSRGRKSR